MGPDISVTKAGKCAVTKASLVAAGEEAHEDQAIGWIAERLAQYLGEGLLQFGLGGGWRAHHRQGEEGKADDAGEDQEYLLPRIETQKKFGGGCAEHLTQAACGGRDAQRHGAVFVRCGAADDGEDDAEAHARDAESDKDFQQLVRTGCGCEGRQDQTGGIADHAHHDGLAVAEPVGNRTEDRLADAPGEVLDGDGERELRPWPAEFVGNGKLEHAEAGADRETDHQDDTARNQDRG